MCCPSGFHAGIGSFPCPSGEPDYICSFDIHFIYLLRSRASETKTTSFPVLGLTLALHLDQARIRKALQITAVDIGDVDLRVTSSKR